MSMKNIKKFVLWNFRFSQTPKANRGKSKGHPKSLNPNFPSREKKKLSTIELKNMIFSDFVKIF